MNSVNFEYYKAFFYTAKYGTISRAAEHLYVTQPSLTKGIQKLEAQLDCTLFVRTTKGMTLTPEGHILYERVAPACEQILAAEEEIYKLKHLEAGTVRLNSVTSVLENFLVPNISEFSSSHKNIKFEISKYSLTTVIGMMQAGELDLTIDYEDMLYKTISSNNIQDVNLRTWAGKRIHTIPVAGKKYRHLAVRDLSTEEIASCPLILKPPYHEEPSLDFYRAMFRSEKYPGDNDVVSDNLETRIALAKNNMGIAFVPKDSVRDQIEAGSLFALHYQELLPQKRLVVSVNADRPLSLVAQKFLDYLIEKEQLKSHDFSTVRSK